MEKQEIELTQSIVKLAQEMQHDRVEERILSDKKNQRQTIVSIVMLIVLAVILMYDIHESYSDVTIENSSSAKIEERRDVNE